VLHGPQIGLERVVVPSRPIVAVTEVLVQLRERRILERPPVERQRGVREAAASLEGDAEVVQEDRRVRVRGDAVGQDTDGASMSFASAAVSAA
jgi:hypothetical protein